MPSKARRSRNSQSQLYVIGGEKLLPINRHHIAKILPKTNNQLKVFEAYSSGLNIVMAGSAGSGKTFLSLYLALRDVFDASTAYEKVTIVRSTVPTRNQGFLPGDIDEKTQVYELPYKSIVKQLINSSITGDIYEKLKSQGSIEFISTSYVRGITIDNAVIVVDEFSNLSSHELDSIITRAGENCRIVFAGDTKQSDLMNDKYEHVNFLKILQSMKSFGIVNFGVEDIVRSGLVKEYLIAKDKLDF
jgi:predicted ribonuclease YlaK